MNKHLPTTTPPELEALREKLKNVRGQRYWRSLQEAADSPEFREMLHREFAPGASEWRDEFSRRSFLKIAGVSLALAGLVGCTKRPNEKVLPYVRQPQELTPGEACYYASSMVLGGYATGVMVKSREGHPIKVDGNPEHPASLGGSSPWMQASILDLYDPDRSQAVTRNGEISTWNALLSELVQLAQNHEARQGEGLRILTETVTSPTLGAQLTSLLQKFPRAKWHQFDPISRDNVREGARLAFGEIVETQYRVDRASVILSLEADFLSVHPQRLRYAREFSQGRRVSTADGKMNRLYVAESTPSVTGSMADHHWPLGSSEIVGVAHEIARQLGVLPRSNFAGGKSEATRWISAVVRDLQHNAGKSIIIAGEWQPPTVHALVHLLNDKLGNIGQTLFYTEPSDYRPTNHLQSLRELADEIKAGSVETLLILGGNPAYCAPADLRFGELLSKVTRTIHLGCEVNETAAASRWHVPQAHYLESWGDARSFDGTFSLLQPLIEPLYGGKTVHEVLGAILQPQPFRGDYEIVRDHWRGNNAWPNFEHGWRRALHDGFIAHSEFPPKTVRLNSHAVLMAQHDDSKLSTAMEVNFRPDPSIWDGRFLNNGWLQECPRPVSKLTWDNAMIVSPALAQRSGLSINDLVELEIDGRKIIGPIWIQPGQAENSITLHLGYGRRKVGRVGTGVGFNAGDARTSDAFWSAQGEKLTKLKQRHTLVATQTHHNVENAERQILREGTLEEFRKDNTFVKKSIESPLQAETLYNPKEYRSDGYKWGMSIDLNVCIGCSACLLSCNAENNIPVVGKEQVRMNREMHWIRIDTYYEGPLDNPRFTHMPVPCMHCEHAPCELVCPVGATVHDHEGLNVQVYNRCVGTRFCSNNCPYKVRRFNFLWYSDYKTPSLKPMYNPDVTVRWRGVMEKCTYCVQRISAARITAEKDNRRIRDGEIQTACQQACPVEAIVFGDLNAPDSKVAALKNHPLDYPMLGGLNTRPRTTYLARLRNPNPEIDPLA